MSQPLVSILVPTFNGEKHLLECLESISQQTYQEFEVVIVDDCSCDATFDIAESVASKDRRVRLYRNDRNHGLVGNWNRCIDLAYGKWIKFAFQDDILEAKCLESLISSIDSNSLLAFCRRSFIFDEGTPPETIDYYRSHINSETLFGEGVKFVSPKMVCEAATDHLGVNFFGEPTASLIHRSAFEVYGRFDESLIMICDTEFWVRVASHSGFSYVPETLAQFRVHGGSTSAKNFARRRYRMQLDGILLMRAYLHGQQYKAFRSVLRRSGRLHVLRSKFLRSIRGAEWLAKDADRRENARDGALMQEWTKFLAEYPSLIDDVRRSRLMSTVEAPMEPLRRWLAAW